MEVRCFGKASPSDGADSDRKLSCSPFSESWSMAVYEAVVDLVGILNC
jgi:hypothetical protein